MPLLRNRGGSEGTQYQMREKMFAIGDDFSIETNDGDRAFKVNGKALRIRDTLVLESPAGDELYTIQEKKVRVRDTMEVEQGGKTVATIKKALVSPLRDRYSIEVEGGGDLEAKGNIVDHEYKIERDGDKWPSVEALVPRPRHVRHRDSGRAERGPHPRRRSLHRPDGPRRVTATPNDRVRQYARGTAANRDNLGTGLGDMRWTPALRSTLLPHTDNRYWLPWG